MLVILKNSFHNTEGKVRVTHITDGEIKLSESQFNRLNKKLCGIEGCICSGISNNYSYWIDDDNFYWINIEQDL